MWELFKFLLVPFLSGIGNALGAGGGGQELDSFVGERFGNLSLDPRNMLGHALTGVTRLGQGFSELAAEPVTLRSSFAQAPPTFTGGGLPMPIGVTGRDPAVANPSLLSLPGIPNLDPFQSLGIVNGDPRSAGSGSASSGGGSPSEVGSASSASLSDPLPVQPVRRRNPGQDLLRPGSGGPAHGFGGGFEEALAALELLGLV